MDYLTSLCLRQKKEDNLLHKVVRLNELIYMKCTEKYLAHSKCSINAKYSYYGFCDRSVMLSYIAMCFAG